MFRFLDSDAYLAVPRIVGHLFNLEVFHIQVVLTIEIDIKNIIFDAIRVLLGLTERAQGVWRTAEAGNVTLTVLGPAHHIWELFGAA